MSKDIQIKKTVFSKDNFEKVIDRSFKTFAQPPEVEEQLTVQQFFVEYENLYYDIPPEGETNSHQYLIQKSSEIVDFDKNTDEIQPLLDEIAQLREEILSYQQQLIAANTPS
jgi:hypothetical protein